MCQLMNSTQKKNLCSGIFMIKKNKFLVCTITFSYLKNAMWKKLNRNGYELYESIYVKCFKKQIIENENGSAFAWLRMEARIRCK